MTLTPVPQLYTFDDYVALDTEQRLELVDGDVVEMNPPTVEHFLIAKYIEHVLDGEIKRLQHPWFCFREAGVRTGPRRSRLSDVCVVTLEQVKDIQGTSTVFQTPPVLAVEVVSPDSITRDYRYKKSEYAALGIPEYWIVDPMKSTITLLLLNEGLYDETILGTTQVISSPTFNSLTLSVSDIFAAGKVD